MLIDQHLATSDTGVRTDCALHTTGLAGDLCGNGLWCCDSLFLTTALLQKVPEFLHPSKYATASKPSCLGSAHGAPLSPCRIDFGEVCHLSFLNHAGSCDWLGSDESISVGPRAGNKEALHLFQLASLQHVWIACTDITRAGSQ